jgi:2-keto-4-pentenoate hydratase
MLHCERLWDDAFSYTGKVFISMSIAPERESALRETADALLTARRTHTPIVDLPSALAPATEEEAFYIQDVIAQAYGAIGGWKIGSRGPEGVPFFAPMPAAWVGEPGALFSGPTRRLRGVEAEIAFRIGADLPARSVPYTRDEVIAAIAGCHPAVEILESAYVDPMVVSRENMLADMQMHGGFVAGPAVDTWQGIDWSGEKVTLLADGAVRVENTGSNPGGSDLLRLLVFLANEGAARTGGLKRGDWITTGSWTGVTWVSAGSEVIAHFGQAGRASMQFGTETF